jgi:cold shock CspA family protein
MRSTSLLRFKLGNVEKFFSIKGFGFISGDDGTQYYFSRSSVGNNPMMLFGGERVRFEALLSDKSPECVSLVQQDGTPFSRSMQYGVLFRSGEECSIYAGKDTYLSIPTDDVIQQDLLRGGNCAGTSVGVPVSFYIEDGKPQSIIRAAAPARKRVVPTSEVSSSFVQSSKEAKGRSPFASEKGRGRVASDADDIANILDSFETK